MTSGLTAKVSPPSNNIFQAIDASAGAVTWKSFQESMTGTCGAGSRREGSREVDCVVRETA